MVQEDGQRERAVAIVGGGPVGMLLALFLDRCGISMSLGATMRRRPMLMLCSRA